MRSLATMLLQLAPRLVLAPVGAVPRPRMVCAINGGAHLLIFGQHNQDHGPISTKAGAGGRKELLVVDPGYNTGSGAGLDPADIAKYRCPPIVSFGMRSRDSMASM